VMGVPLVCENLIRSVVEARCVGLTAIAVP
jgi:hypothetical protein